jgi:putative membrane protein
MLLFWGVVLAGIIILIRSVFSKGGHGDTRPAESALDILKKRYAKGEIGQDEFEEKKRVIEE